MPKFRKKPIVIEAEQWFGPGDHTEVSEYLSGAVIVNAGDACRKCEAALDKHGWVETLEGGHIVCPKDWIITGVKGEHYPIKPDIFEATYERVEEAAASSG